MQAQGFDVDQSGDATWDASTAPSLCEGVTQYIFMQIVHVTLQRSLQFHANKLLVELQSQICVWELLQSCTCYFMLDMHMSQVSKRQWQPGPVRTTPYAPQEKETHAVRSSCGGRKPIIICRGRQVAARTADHVLKRSNM